LKRRDFLSSLAVAAAGTLPSLNAASVCIAPTESIYRRVRPSDAAWPSAASWTRLQDTVGGQLIKVQAVFQGCASDPEGAACADARKNISNPYWLGDQPGGTENSGWLDAWTPAPSAYAIKARHAGDVAAGVAFARENRLRLVVKGGGHSYLGTSNAPDSLLIWTRAMNPVTLHDAFVGQGCAGRIAPVPAVSAGAGALWMDLYHAVTTEGGRYVQGGSCTTVGVAGLVQSGGFNAFSKGFGAAAAGLLEAEIVTADGRVRVVNACQDPDLFWALKGGGGGTFGVVTRMTLRTHELPRYFGAAWGEVKARSNDAFAHLIVRFVDFYRETLFNPHWGEHVHFRPDNVLEIEMVSQGLSPEQAQAAWQPFFDWVKASPHDFELASPGAWAWDARSWWDLDKRASTYIHDPRAGAPRHHAWGKGLAGAPDEVRAAARQTATNPAVLDAFTLVIIAEGEQPPAYPGYARPAMDLAAARKNARAIDLAAAELRRIAPDSGSYVSESNYFNRGWQREYWGGNYARLLAIKSKVDPEGLFFVHHGVGSESWSADGFTRLG